MGFIIEHRDSSTDLYYWSTTLVKSSGGVFVPQLFYDKRPILHSLAIPASTWNKRLHPKVTSQKWKCFTHDLRNSSMPWYGIAASNLGWNISGTIFWPKIENHIVKDLNSGLTSALEDMKSGSRTFSSSAIRTTRSSISTSYINVFAWAVFDKGTVNNHAMPMISWDNYAYLDITLADQYPFIDGVHNFNDRLIDNERWGLYMYYGTYKKPSSGTYLHVAPPMARNTVGDSMNCKGWGIILEPTNTNTYPTD